MSWVSKNVTEEIAGYVFNIKLDLDKRTLFQRDVRPDLVIEFDSLEQQLAELPEMLCFFDQLLAEQRAKVATIEAGMEVAKATIIEGLLDSSKQHNIKLSVQTMNNIVYSDERMIVKQAELIRESKRENKLRAVVYALQRKSEHLRSLAGFKREEIRQS